MLKQKQEEAKKVLFRKELLKWWENNKRNFPWRKHSGVFEVTVAEMLLRKTTAKQVEKIYPELLSRWPDPCQLSLADEQELNSLLRPLGMHRERARLLRIVAEMLCTRFGHAISATQVTPDTLKNLPGIGPYARNMILAVTKNQPLPGLDGNFIRVLRRFFGIVPAKKRPHTDPALWALASSLMPKRRGRDFNWAVLDFGASVCRPTKPRCAECPLKGLCAFYGEQKKNALTSAHPEAL